MRIDDGAADRNPSRFLVELAYGSLFSSKLWTLEIRPGKVVLRRSSIAHILTFGLTRLPGAAGPYSADSDQTCIATVTPTSLNSGRLVFRRLGGEDMFAVIPAPTQHEQLLQALQREGFAPC